MRQLPAEREAFTRYLAGLTARLDHERGWYAVFLDRDPEGMRLCAAGVEVPPWDLVESLLHDLVTAHGSGFVAEEEARARRLHSAAVSVFDRRPGGVQALEAGVERTRGELIRATVHADELTRLLESPPRGADDAGERERVVRELRWAHDLRARATARLAELRGRLDALTDRTPAAAPPPLLSPSPEPPESGELRDSGRAPVALPGPLPPAAPDTTGYGGAPGHGGAVAPFAAEPPSAGPDAGPDVGADPAAVRAGNGGDPYGDGPPVRAERHQERQEEERRGPKQKARRRRSLGARFAGARAPHAGEAATDPARYETAEGRSPAGGSVAGAAGDGAGTGGTARPGRAVGAGDGMAVDPAGSAPFPGGGGGGGFSGVGSVNGVHGNDRPDGVTGPDEAMAPYEAHQPAAPADPHDPDEAAVAHGAREVAGTLALLRRQGRGGEAYGLICEAAALPAEWLPAIGEALHHAGLGADWTTLLWEAAAQPLPRVAAVAAALSEWGWDDDGAQLLRQGVVRPVAEIADTVLLLDDLGQGDRAPALLIACVQQHSAADAARVADPAPARLVPALLAAARAAGGSHERDLTHALRVAGHLER
ncbi:hypothetical protein ACFVIM_06475 [Streptomyces sp. NPDC057638]|uniref:hypothetical protein n=1 Tax=Streptomyces sp. NPDC057638 TaxID=3346190 RepID=UPI00368530B2